MPLDDDNKQPFRRRLIVAYVRSKHQRRLVQPVGVPVSAPAQIPVLTPVQDSVQDSVQISVQDPVQASATAAAQSQSAPTEFPFESKQSSLKDVRPVFAQVAVTSVAVGFAQTIWEVTSTRRQAEMSSMMAAALTGGVRTLGHIPSRLALLTGRSAVKGGVGIALKKNKANVDEENSLSESTLPASQSPRKVRTALYNTGAIVTLGAVEVATTGAMSTKAKWLAGHQTVNGAEGFSINPLTPKGCVNWVRATTLAGPAKLAAASLNMLAVSTISSKVTKRLEAAAVDSGLDCPMLCAFTSGLIIGAGTGVLTHFPYELSDAMTKASRVNDGSFKGPSTAQFLRDKYHLARASEGGLPVASQGFFSKSIKKIPTRMGNSATTACIVEVVNRGFNPSIDDSNTTAKY